MNMRITSALTLSVAGLAFFAAAACGETRGGFTPSPPGFDPNPPPDAGDCPFQCSIDGRSVVRSCTGEVIETCPPEQACGAASCQEPCSAAAADQSSNGCDFYFQSPATEPAYAGSCYATFIVNTSTQPVDVTLEREGKTLDLSKSMFRTAPGDATLFAHTGPIAPGESAILFLSEASSATARYHVACPSGVTAAVLEDNALSTTGIGSSFRLKSSAPVSLVAMHPFGGAASFLPTATLLLPVVTWAKQHVLVAPWEAALYGGKRIIGLPTTQIVASEDDTELTIRPTRDITTGPGVNGTLANVPATYRLDKGQHLQLVQLDELSGSIVSSNKPTTVFSGHTCAQIPATAGACDVFQQQIPAYEHWGSEYVAVGYRPRLGDEDEAMPYRIVAARDGTRLDYDPTIPAGAPTELSAGEVATFPAGVGDAFVVRTQDADHPIYLAAYMTGVEGGYFGAPGTGFKGDPEFVNVVPAGQYLSSYSFYADPTYAETSLVIVRAKSHGAFKDVWLECAGNLTDFRPIGTRGDYEFTRVDLARGGLPGQTFGDKTCQTGLQRMKSEGPFTATLWGWGSYSSYAYPGGMANRKLVTTPLDLLR
ncbi:MAG: hypothetical protein BGO98_35475 [Myxococcales bacterium 68-20]|nr:IgGFc-binding protein [Myxococcales bacterium]OJY25899.1 MAG: hypothetical protein BGO98_35475 [Myxococcales bacterium 68-20]